MDSLQFAKCYIVNLIYIQNQIEKNYILRANVSNKKSSPFFFKILSVIEPAQRVFIRNNLVWKG